MSFCPTMDLLAVVTIEERVEVYRLSGQRAFGLQRKIQGVKVESMCWKYNGRLLSFQSFASSSLLLLL
jgi:anaphase-promoting complex subunit 4